MSICSTLPPTHWSARVRNGRRPLAADGAPPHQPDASTREKAPLYLLGEVDVVEEGEVELKIELAKVYNLWVDQNPIEVSPFESGSVATIKLAAGRHKIVVRVDGENDSPQVRVSLSRPAGSTAQFDIVAGQ